jgi:site-specific DNA recombinase
MIAALYVRVSTTEQAIDGFSISAQTRLLSEYCQKNDIKIYKVYADEGISGQKENRPAFQQMLKDSLHKPFDIILVHKFDRFARKVELSRRVKQQLRKSGINVVSITEPIEDSPIGFFQEGIMELLAEYYSKNLSAEVKKGHKERAEQGLHNGSVPFGYKIDHSVDSKMVIEEDQAKIIEWIFLSYLNGSGLNKIANSLNDSSIKGSVGGKWCTKSISMILKNPKYVGMIKLGNNIFKGFHTPIIDQNTWDAVQALLNYQSSRYTYRGSNHETRYLLSLCKCSDCGRAVIIRKNGKNKYYVCSSNRSNVSDKCTNSMTFRAEVLEQYIQDTLKEIFENNNLDFDVIKKPNEKQFADNRVNTLKNILNRLKEGYLNGLFEISEYKKMKENIDNELNELESQTETINKDKLITLYRNYYDQFINCNDAGEKRAILKKFVDVIYIGKNNIRIYFYAN